MLNQQAMKIEIDKAEFDREFEENFKRLKEATRETLRYAGETYAATAKEKGSYKDQSGHLRAANSFGIFENGRLVENNTEVEADTGANDSLDGMNQQNVSGDMVLVLANGKEYASAVEAKGYDVASSGHLAAENTLKKLFR